MGAVLSMAGRGKDGARQDGARQDGARQDGAQQDGARRNGSPAPASLSVGAAGALGNRASAPPLDDPARRA
jgi:hypothetical protein